MKIEPINTTNQGANNETPKTGSFYNRIVELGPISIATAAAAITAYMLNVPIMAIGIGVGTILICNRLFARSTEVVDSTISTKEGSFAFRLKVTNALHLKEALIPNLEQLIEEFDEVSIKNQVALIQLITSKLDYGIEKQVKDMINADKFNHVDKFKAFVEGCVAFFEQVASDNAEKTKSDALLGAVYQLQRFLVEKQAAQIEANKQSLELIKLHQSLDNLIIKDSSLQKRINEIKQALPLSPEEQLALNFINMESRNTETRSTALKNLVKAYRSNPDYQIEILKAIIKMLSDNKDIYLANGYNALGEIQLFIQNGKIDSAAKLQATVDGFADYLNNPGEIDPNSVFQDNQNAKVLDGLIDALLPQFINQYKTEIKNTNINLTQLKLSLEKVRNDLPDKSLMDSIKGKITRILNTLS